MVISNFCGHQVQLPLPAEIRNIEGEWLIGNYPPRHGLAEEITLQPYESFAISWLNN